ncbi:hypothetical protein SNK03_004753 [Fusarium graminearum]|uniref:Chromosome 2, complete genome n=2 Tax=Gibberella zeae TaxID=5518 RepID=I1RW20_GIBZE|nr:hypothetical protein FGSG_08472 [Fusarium graminearum PH-1]EYB27805.1 hypothetical protein FG05_08472 [Fusarium graminearum]ESU14868.1 hypothetical protein FGSG_08472 [Fusarium graminearum PH-1]CAF3461838.1 unnamed protein product [Fusarium graminearum]CAF3484552.1 unnamed protein product [Fusarium graminearum]CAG2008044.1 unnamed protein product [Fusarium graminearum]|eukprot:XP_011320293.1 hypothetical protein FGSG_08472 [Fusarium graminearum PH-1]
MSCLKGYVSSTANDTIGIPAPFPLSWLASVSIRHGSGFHRGALIGPPLASVPLRTSQMDVTPLKDACHEVDIHWCIFSPAPCRASCNKRLSLAWVPSTFAQTLLKLCSVKSPPRLGSVHGPLPRPSSDEFPFTAAIGNADFLLSRGLGI